MTVQKEQVIVVGAGPAGCACAIQAAKLGLSVLLIDEHPQSPAAMSLDAPYFYGARLSSRLSDAGAVADSVLGANEPLMDALEAGVEVLTGTSVWGVFRPDAGNPATRGRQLGLCDESRSWLVEYEWLVLANGARDLVLSFANWQLPGVLGVLGASTLLSRYEALGGSEILILGSNDFGLDLAAKALDAGLAIKGIVDPASDVQGDAELAGALKEAGVPLFLGHTIAGAKGSSAVEAASLVPLAADGTPLSQDAFELACDTIVMAYGAVPNVELAAIAGCKLAFDPGRGGWVPVLDSELRTTDERIYVIGDAAGVSAAAWRDAGSAIAQGTTVASAIARTAGLEGDGTPLAEPASGANHPPQAWLDSLVAAGGMDVMLCQCEEVSRRELLGVAPPRYLSASGQAPAAGLHSLSSHAASSQDQLKRLTRVGMGHCQGRRCREHGAMLVAKTLGIDLASVSPGSYRVPARALPLHIMQADEETAAERANWTTWLHEVDDPIPEAPAASAGS